MKIKIARTGKQLAAGLLTGMVLTTSSLAQDVTVKLSFNQPETSASWQKVYEVYANDLETLSDNRIKVERYPNSVLHPVGNGFKALVSGITDITAAYPIYMASSFNLIQANELPHALPDNDYAAVRLVSELYPDYYRAEYERMGVYLAFTGVNGSYDIMTKTPINSLDDLKGLKLRAAGGTLTKVAEKLGAVPVNITIADAYSAFQQGVVDGIFLSSGDMVAYNLDDIGTHVYQTGIARVFVPTAMRKEMYDNLPDDLKSVVVQAGRNAAMNMAKMYYELNEDGLTAMQEKSIVISTPSDADMAKMDKLLASIYDDFITANASQTDPSAEDVISALKEGKDKFDGMTNQEIIAYDKEYVVDGLFR